MSALLPRRIPPVAAPADEALKEESDSTEGQMSSKQKHAWNNATDAPRQIRHVAMMLAAIGATEWASELRDTARCLDAALDVIAEEGK